MKRSERGFTLIEILVALAIVALIGGAASMATFQVITGTKRSSNHMTAIRQVQNAGYWISRDTLMAQSVVIGDDPVTTEVTEFLTLNWSNWDSDIHRVAYTLEDGELKRSHSEGGGEPGQIAVAQFINSADCDFTDTDEDGVDDTLISTLTATIGTGSQQAIETRVYRTIPRPG